MTLSSHSASRRRALQLAAAALVMPNLAGCTNQPGRSLRIGGGPNVSMLVLVAQTMDLFAQQEVIAEYRSLQTSKIAFDAVAANQIDIGVVTDANLALIGYAGFGEVRIIGSIMTKTDDAIIARRAAGIRAPADLRGKKIAYTPASSGEVFLNFFLAQHELRPADVVLTSMTAPAMLVALQHGDVDAVSVWQPFRYNIATTLGPDGVQFENGGIYPAKILLIATRNTIEARAEDLRKLFVAVEAASSYVQAHSAESIALLAPQVGVDAGTLAATWPEYDFRGGDTVNLAEDLRRIARAVSATQPDLQSRPIPDYGTCLSLNIQQQVLEARSRP